MFLTRRLTGLRGCISLALKAVCILLVLSLSLYAEVSVEYKNEGIYIIWVAVGDDARYGTATAYDIRYTVTSETDMGLWDAYQHSVVPDVSGSAEEVRVNLPPEKYRFAIRVRDEMWNWSPWSNEVVIDLREIEPPIMMEWIE